MKIRAITLGASLTHNKQSLDSLKTQLESITELRKQFLDNNIDVQTVRLCTNPYDINSNYDDDFYSRIPETLDFIDSLTREKLLAYYSYLPGLCDQQQSLSSTQRRVMQELPNYLAKHAAMFSSVQVSSVENGISLEAISSCARIIKELAENDPFENLQFAATFDVPPNTPFFPSAYHKGQISKISIALEAADEVVNITREFSESNRNLKWLEEKITTRFSEIYDEITDLVKPFCTKHKIGFSGMDFSPAQYPIEEKSIGTAIENITLSHFGEVGTVFAIGFLTSTLQKINRPKIGFSGFMQPLLEDFTIAKRHDEKKFSLPQMLLNSTVCGLGLDCIPLPGDVSEESLTLLMMDVAMISSRIHKPLTCRLMPIPGKSNAERTEFDFEFFTNSKICEIHPSSHSKKLKDFLSQNPSFLI